MTTFGEAYSKWDNIELSDDESDLHPNIDKDSWFRMKHRTRLEREEKEDKEIEAMNRSTADDEQRLKIINARIKAIQSGQLDPDEASVDDIEGRENYHMYSLSLTSWFIPSIFKQTSSLPPDRSTGRDRRDQRQHCQAQKDNQELYG